MQVMTVSSMIEPGRSAPAALRRGWGVAVLGVAFGVALTLSMQGYQFGKSNHTVYLIDAMRQRSAVRAASTARR